MTCEVCHAGDYNGAWWLAPGEDVAPGLVGLVCGMSLVIAGVALVVLVLRRLLTRAVELDVTAHQLRAELDEVI